MTLALASPEQRNPARHMYIDARGGSASRAMAAVAPPASALLQALIQDTATEEDLRRVDEHPEVLLDALAHWVDVQLAACLDAASDSATGEVGPRQVAAVPVRRIEPVAAPRPQLPAASDFPPLSAAAAPQKTKQRRRMAPTPVAVAPAVQLGDAASSSAAEPFKAPAEQLAPPTPGHGGPRPARPRQAGSRASWRCRPRASRPG